MINREIHRGDIIVTEANGKNGYAVVVTNDTLNFSRDVVLAVNITTREVDGGPAYAPLTVNYPGHAVCDRVWSVREDSIIEFVRECTTEEMASIDKALRYTFGLVEVGAVTAPYKETESLKAENKDLSCKVHEQMEQIRNLNRELEDARKDAELFMAKAVGEKDRAADLVSMTAERDTYKALYYNLIDKILEK